MWWLCCSLYCTVVPSAWMFNAAVSLKLQYCILEVSGDNAVEHSIEHCNKLFHLWMINIFQSRCPDLVCYKNVTYLESCTLHTFTLTAHYKSVDGVVTTGAPRNTDATTSGPGEMAVHCWALFLNYVTLLAMCLILVKVANVSYVFLTMIVPEPVWVEGIKVDILVINRSWCWLN